MVMTLMSNPKGSVATVIVSQAGDGDTTDIQTGIDLLPAGGGVVYIKEGTYTITVSITFPNENIAIFGSGRSTNIYTTMNDAIFDINQNYTSIRDLFIQGNSTGTSQAGIVLTNVGRSFIHNCWIEDLGGNGISVGLTSASNIISNNHIDNIELNGIYFLADNRTHSLNIISENTITDTGRNGIYILGRNASGLIIHTIISNNHINNADKGDTGTYSCITLDTAVTGSVDRTQILGNSCTSADNYGIDLQDGGVDRTIVTSNIVLANTTGQINDNGSNTELGHNITV